MPAAPLLNRQLVQVCREVSSFIDGMTRDAFMDDLKTQRAVEMTFVIIAEIADRIRSEEPDLFQSLPSVPWAQIRGMRNRLVHGYLAINLDTVWATASISIPQLSKALEHPQSGA